MNCFIKELQCFFCTQKQSVHDANFSEDIFDLITRHENHNLFWMCELCKNDRHRMISFLKNYDSCGRKQDLFTCDENKNTDTTCLYSNCKEIEPFRNNTSSKFCVDGNAYYSGPSLSEKARLLLKSSEECSSESPGGTLSSLAPRNDKSALKYLHTILNTIKIPPEEESRNKQILMKVLDAILSKLKENDEFNNMFNRLYYTGSAYTDLKISSASEYDIDLVLKVPKHVTLTPEFLVGNSAFLKLRWDVNKDADSSVVKFLTENSVDGYIQPQKVLSWLQRHVDLILQQKLELPSDVLQVRKSSSGPAKTVIIYTDFGCPISVDLVPVFEFDYSALSSTPFYSKITEIIPDGNKNKFLVVPKECVDAVNITIADSKLSWRLDFPDAEKHILSNKGCAKSVVKILKIFRDKRQWKDLASYYLKMVIILEIIKNPLQEHWSNSNLFQRLLDCLIDLRDHLKDHYLPHFLTQHNLLSKLNDAQCNGWSNHVKNVIKSVESCPEKITELFLEH